MELTAPWQPANDVERGMRDALARGDVEGYRRVLGSATVSLPVPPGLGYPGASPDPLPWATGEFDGRTYILAFTSPEALRAAVGADTTAYRPALFADVAHAWPDPRAWLAVDLGTPIQALLDAEGVHMTAWLGELSGYPVDAALRAAIRAGDDPAYALALLAADIVVPVRPEASSIADLTDPLFGWWRTETAEGDPVIVVYTSVPRLRADLGQIHDDVDHVVVDLGELAAAWPDRETSMAVNPGTPVAGLISGAAVHGLAEWVARAEDAAERAAEAATGDPSMGEFERELAAHQAARDAVTRILRG
jgi:hypothetical protein